MRTVDAARDLTRSGDYELFDDVNPDCRRGGDGTGSEPHPSKNDAFIDRRPRDEIESIGIKRPVIDHVNKEYLV